MISFRTGSYRFHYRAAAIILDGGDLLLHRLQGDAFWALPGGRVEAGETGEAALFREFREELGLYIERVELAATGENFFSYDSEPHHEIGLYFYVSLPVSSALRDKSRTHIGIEGVKHLEFRWFPRSELESIDMRPVALKQALSTGEVPRHFVQRG